MTARARLPVLPLLGLAFTACGGGGDDDDASTEPATTTDTGGGPSVDAIVGDWVAVAIDDVAYPMVYDYEGYSLRQGFAMAIEADLAGDFSFYYVGGYEGVESGSFHRFQLAVDAAGAPAYVLTIHNGLQAPPFANYDYEETSYGYDSDYGYESEGYGSDTAYGTSGYETGGDTVASGPVEDRDQVAAPIALGPEDTLILRCTLTGAAADALECTREPADDLGKLEWRFRRPGPDEPSGV